MNETQLTKAIIQLLEACGWYVIRTHRPGQFATQRGVSDLIVIGQSFPYEPKGVRAKVAFIEVKGPRGNWRDPDQIAFIDEMRSRGHIAFMTDSVETVIDRLDLPLKV